MNLLHALAALAAALIWCSVARGDEASDKSAILKIEQELAESLAKNDLDAMRKHLAPDWKIVTGNGDILGFDRLSKVMQSSKLRFESYKISDLEVRLFENAAVVVGTDDSKGL